MIDNKTIRKVIMLNKMLPSGSPTYENREASGAVANFTTNTVQPFVKCECTIDATESGTSVLNVEQTGKNLFDISQFATLYPQYCTFENDVLNVQGNVVLYSTGVEVKAPAGAKLSATVTDITSVNARFRLVYTDGSYSEVYPNQLPFSLLKDLASVRLNWSTNGTFKIENAQIEINSTATTYGPYTGSTYTVNLGQTVYGGTADVVGGVGEETHDLLTFDGSEAWNVHGSIASWFYLDGAFPDAFTDGTKNDFAVCNCGVQAKYQNVTGLTNGEFALGLTGSRFRFVFKNTDCTTIEDFKTWLSSNNMQVAYTLATPTSFTFTGQPIDSLLGVNNVWTDSGEVLDVEYRADINLLISELGG